MTLERKPQSKQPSAPKDGIQSMIQLGKTRGKFGSADLAWMMLKSKMERLLTVR